MPNVGLGRRNGGAACICQFAHYVRGARDPYEVPLYANAVSAISTQFVSETPVTFQWENIASVPAGAPVSTWAAMAARRRVESTDTREHHALRLDVIEHLWARRWLSQQ
jgi:hypothetical protein